MGTVIKNILLVIAVVGAFLLSLTLETGPADVQSSVNDPGQVMERTDEDKQKPKLQVQLARVEWPSEKKQPKPEKIKPAQPKPEKRIEEAKQKKKVVGGKSTENKGDVKGDAAINIVADFECSVEFYLSEMKKRGARTVLYAREEGKFYELRPYGIGPGLEGIPSEYSSVARRLSEDYPGSRRIIREAEKSLGAGRYEILMLLPRPLEEKINAFVEGVVRDYGNSSARETSAVFVSYRKGSGSSSLVMFVDSFSFGGAMVSVKKGFNL